MKITDTKVVEKLTQLVAAKALAAVLQNLDADEFQYRCELVRRGDVALVDGKNFQFKLFQRQFSINNVAEFIEDPCRFDPFLNIYAKQLAGEVSPGIPKVILTGRSALPMKGTGAHGTYAETQDFGLRVLIGYDPNTLGQLFTIDFIAAVVA